MTEGEVEVVVGYGQPINMPFYVTESGEIIVEIENQGTQTVNLDSIYINNTYIGLNPDWLGIDETFEIGVGDTITVTIPYTVLQNWDYLILARTKEGAEHQLTENAVT